MGLRQADFLYVSKLARESAAIVIDPDRGYLVESRLAPLAEQEGFGTISNLVDALRSQRDPGRLHVQVIDALTTNETLFFRDHHPFEALRSQVLPELLHTTLGRTLNIWSAACSTGQEAYSLAMMIKEAIPAIGPSSVHILGTDLATRVVVQATAGSYSQLEAGRGLPAPMLLKYFRQDGCRWTIRDDLRALVRFEQMNLSEDWPGLPLFDLIMIRNVLIYFDREVRRKVLEKVARQLHPDGYLLMGSAENPMSAGGCFRTFQVGKALFYKLA